MRNRIIINPSKLKFIPFNSYGKKILGMSWHKISYNQNTGVGSYILKMAPGTRSLKHRHNDYEEFYVLDANLQASPYHYLPQILNNPHAAL